jgi:hypothetical protein
VAVIAFVAGLAIGCCLGLVLASLIIAGRGGAHDG